MKTKTLTRLILAAAVFALVAQPHAQLPVGSHYPVGAEGIKGGSLPPPGVYFRDYNFFYTADRFPGSGLVDFDLFAYVQAPRLIWITKQEILGANYGMDVIVPFGYTQMRISPAPGVEIEDHAFGLRDIQIEPLLLSWHKKQFDIAAGYAVWAPTGSFDINKLANLGNGYWSHMLTLGGVWYPDEKKTWAVSLLNRYEICHEQDQTQVTPGNMFTLEWGVSKNIGCGTDLGLIGYWQQQVTDDSGTHASARQSHVLGVGPEINTFWPKIGLFTSLRYVYEADARNRPQGHTFTLTLTKIF